MPIIYERRTHGHTGAFGQELYFLLHLAYYLTPYFYLSFNLDEIGRPTCLEQQIDL